jgi:hypothetical protein
MVNEWNIGKHRVKYDPSRKVLYLKVNGDYHGQEHREFLNLYKIVFRGKNRERFALVDLNDATPLDRKTRRAMKDEEEKLSEGTDKMAFTGASPAIRMIAKLYMKFSKNKDVGFFKTEEEALSWLKSDVYGRENT